MKKKIMTITLMCSVAMGANAQVYADDSWMQLPTADLYDNSVMNMSLRSLAEMAAKRKENYFRYSDMAVEAFSNRQWDNVIYYVNEALETGYYSGKHYYIRGYAFEQLGNIRAAKKDYKIGKKYNCTEAAQALESLKAKNKRRQK